MITRKRESSDRLQGSHHSWHDCIGVFRSDRRLGRCSRLLINATGSLGQLSASLPPRAARLGIPVRSRFCMTVLILNPHTQLYNVLGGARG